MKASIFWSAIGVLGFALAVVNWNRTDSKPKRPDPPPLDFSSVESRAVMDLFNRRNAINLHDQEGQELFSVDYDGTVYVARKRVARDKRIAVALGEISKGFFNPK